MHTLVVTGAAGNLGRRVVARLSASPDVERVVAVDVMPVVPTSAEVEAHVLDLSARGAEDELAALGKRADGLVHLAWNPEGSANLGMLQRVLAAAAVIEPFQLVHLSSATVYGAWADNPVPLTEDTALRPNPELAYAVEKRAAECSVERWAATHPGVAVAVLRPVCTVGWPSRPLYQALATCPPPGHDDGRLVQYLHVDDLASAVVHALQRRLAGTYNVAPDNGIREELAGALAGGTPPLPQSVRAIVWRWRLWRRGAPTGARAYAEHSWVVASDKLRASGWQPQYSSEEALVVSDGRAHWDELPLGRRHSVAVAGAAAALAVGGTVGSLWWRRRR